MTKDEILIWIPDLPCIRIFLKYLDMGNRIVYNDSKRTFLKNQRKKDGNTIMKMKKLLLLLGVMLMGICLLCSCGSKESSMDKNGFRYTELEDGTYSVSLENCTAEEVLIPAEYNGQKVTAIGGMCINTDIVSIKVPNTVTKIGDRAFYYCTSLKEITIPNSVKSIGEEAFFGCVSLSAVRIPNKTETIGAKAFSGCASLTEVKIPDSVVTIGEEAFRACTSLAKISVGQNVKNIGAGAFRGCVSLTAIVTPDGIHDIGKEVFKDCESLVTVTLGKGMEEVGNNAFEGCEALVQVIAPDSLKKIGENIFSDCDSLYAVYYAGDKNVWGKIEVKDSNEALTDALCYYSETTPEKDGFFWRYVDNKPVVW